MVWIYFGVGYVIGAVIALFVFSFIHGAFVGKK